MPYIPLTALEGDDPFYTITANKRLPDGSNVPMDLTGGAVTWLVKLSPDVDDVDAIATYPGTILPPATDGRFTVQLTDTVTAVPGNFWYSVRFLASGKQQTLQYGDWFVVNS